MTQRRARRAAQLLWPRPGPLCLGDQVTVRYRALRTGDDAARSVTASIRRTERLPSGATQAITTTTCPVQVVATRPWFEAEVRLEVPLDAVPTMTFAQHSVAWALVLDDPVASEAPVEFPLTVAAQVAPAVLHGGVLR